MIDEWKELELFCSLAVMLTMLLYTEYPPLIFDAPASFANDRLVKHDQPKITERFVCPSNQGLRPRA